MAGYFSRLFETHPNLTNGVASVTRVTDGSNPSITADSVGTLARLHQEETRKRCNQVSVTVNPSISVGYNDPVTPEHQLHQKNSHTEYDAELYQERAAIMEYEGGLNREEAEMHLLLLWIHDHPLFPSTSLCAGCGSPLLPQEQSIEYGGIQLHWDGGDKTKNIRCYEHYIEKRMPEAKTTLEME